MEVDMRRKQEENTQNRELKGKDKAGGPILLAPV